MATKYSSSPYIDLSRYAGTYGGYITEQPKQPTMWQRFIAWLRSK